LKYLRNTALAVSNLPRGKISWLIIVGRFISRDISLQVAKRGFHSVNVGGRSISRKSP